MAQADWRAVSPTGLTLLLKDDGTTAGLGLRARTRKVPPAARRRWWRVESPSTAFPPTSKPRPASRGRRPTSTIDALALAAGIQPEYWEVSGAHHVVSLGQARPAPSDGFSLNGQGRARRDRAACESGPCRSPRFRRLLHSRVPFFSSPRLRPRRASLLAERQAGLRNRRFRNACAGSAKRRRRSAARWPG